MAAPALAFFDLFDEGMLRREVIERLDAASLLALLHASRASARLALPALVAWDRANKYRFMPLYAVLRDMVKCDTERLFDFVLERFRDYGEDGVRGGICTPTQAVAGQLLLDTVRRGKYESFFLRHFGLSIVGAAKVARINCADDRHASEDGRCLGEGFSRHANVYIGRYARVGGVACAPPFDAVGYKLGVLQQTADRERWENEFELTGWRESVIWSFRASAPEHLVQALATRTASPAEKADLLRGFRMRPEHRHAASAARTFAFLKTWRRLCDQFGLPPPHIGVSNPLGASSFGHMDSLGIVYYLADSWGIPLECIRFDLDTVWRHVQALYWWHTGPSGHVHPRYELVSFGLARLGELPPAEWAGAQDVVRAMTTCHDIFIALWKVGDLALMRAFLRLFDKGAFAEAILPQMRSRIDMLGPNGVQSFAIAHHVGNGHDIEAADARTACGLVPRRRFALAVFEQLRALGVRGLYPLRVNLAVGTRDARPILLEALDDFVAFARHARLLPNNVIPAFACDAWD